jgi:hypothetical protein
MPPHSQAKPRAKKRRRRLNPFIEEEAAVEDDDEGRAERGPVATFSTLAPLSSDPV